MYINLQKAFESEQFLNRTTETLIPIGVGFNFEYVFEDLKHLRSIIMAGATGSGKSTFNNSLILSLLKQDNNMSLVLADCKKVELTPYNGTECLIGDVATKPDNTKEQFEFLDKEFFVRATRKKEDTNIYKNYHPIICVIDEYSDIMCSDNHDYFNEKISKIAKYGADLNIFIIICTSRPSTNIFTKEIKDSFFTKIAFSTPGSADSITIIEEVGAEKLLGKGDMLFKKGNEPIKRLQGFYVSDKEKEKMIKSGNCIKKEKSNISLDIENSRNKIKTTLSEYNIEIEIQEINIGPIITQFVLKLKNEKDFSKVFALADILSMNLKVHPLRITSISQFLISLEIPNEITK
ncbi:MAG: DNA translocase FtsK [Patescibacteria group bacterium]|nr:DNA translocase FtsK [Patescibacteria group bacterium]MDD4304516.1 DNA translocase FtsK [Patescibacteria group bacterium]MDD4694876.1 DNA translocase FtsK [Patescibacteria group bacterium]